MNRYHRVCCTVTTLILLAVPSVCAAACPPLDAVPLSTLLLPPPADYSRETLAELGELQVIQGLRTPQDEDHASGDHDQSVQRFLGEIHMDVSPPENVTEFFECIKKSAEEEVKAAKKTFDRTRPYKLANNGLRILKTPDEKDTPSYPSGHATYGMVVGLVLAEMLPEKKKEILGRIEDYGRSRLVSGVHFRSDVYAGQIAGAAIASSYFKSSKDGEFWKQFKDAKEKLRASLQLSPQ